MKSDNSKYLIVCDLDGSLLDDNRKIPKTTINYFKKLNKSGFNIVLASGRPLKNVFYFYKKIGLKTPIISSNGLCIKFQDSKNKDVIFFFDNKNISDILSTVEKKVGIKNVFFSTEDHNYFVKKNNIPSFWKLNMKNEFLPIEKILKKNIVNFIFELEDKNIDEKKIKKILSPFKKNKVCFWVGIYKGFFEIYNVVSNKYKAIINISKKLKIKPDNIFAFGNDFNDIEFLMKLKNAYAMKNSSDEIKKKSHLITKFDNNNFGIERELKTILKNLK